MNNGAPPHHANNPARYSRCVISDGAACCRLFRGRWARPAAGSPRAGSVVAPASSLRLYWPHASNSQFLLYTYQICGTLQPLMQTTLQPLLLLRFTHHGPKNLSLVPSGEWKQSSTSTLIAPSRWAADTGTMKSPHTSASPHTCGRQGSGRVGGRM